MSKSFDFIDDFIKKLLWRNAFSDTMITTLHQPCPPREGGGGACDAPVLPAWIISPAVLCTGNTKSSQPGDATAAGAKPPGASDRFEDFPGKLN